MEKTLDVLTEAKICITNILKHSKEACTKKELQERLKDLLNPSVVSSAIEELLKEGIIGKTIGQKQTKNEDNDELSYEKQYRSKKSVFSDPSYKNDDENMIIQKAREDLKNKLKETVDDNYDGDVLDDIVDKVYPKK